MAPPEQQHGPTSVTDSDITSAAAAPARTSPADQILSSWIAADPLSLELLERVRRVAGSSSTLLIRGESGVGKELVARAIHEGSRRPGRPLVRSTARRFRASFSRASFLAT